MLDFSQTKIVKLAITWAGNKALNEGVVIPGSTVVSVNDYVHEVLTTAFFKPFEKNEEFFYFHHPEDVSQNRTYQACMSIFSNPDAFQEEAEALTRRLYDLSSSPKMTSGEFFLALFDAVELQGESVPAIGIFKIIQKDNYLKVDRSPEHFALGVSEGIGTGKLALAALIFGVDEADGYRLMAIDRVSKKDEASMWLDQFLDARPIEDNYFQTRQYMNMASEFIQEKAVKFGLDKTDKIDLMNRTSFYFKENENFEVDDFVGNLFADEPERQTAFKDFKEDYERSADIQLSDHFDVNKQAVRKTGNVFKSVIKLDENFQIYVKGRRDWIERGFDEEKGRPFYKIYFEQEE